MNKFNELIPKLREILQIDRPELDFGIYRINRLRQRDMEEFLSATLPAKVREQLAGSSALEEDETRVYSHLLQFFSRYYEDGGFISKRRSSRTEVEAEADELPLLSAAPVALTGNELQIYFEYKPMPKGTRQEDLVRDAAKEIFAALGALDGAEFLTTYVSSNKADYFIHKNLGEFLRLELDFYIKNEMLNLDDIQHIGAVEEIGRNLKMIQAMRYIAGELIALLAQLEDFQKKLWLKKKFVVDCQYCITLDRIEPRFYPEILSCREQIAEWKERVGRI